MTEPIQTLVRVEPRAGGYYMRVLDYPLDGWKRAGELSAAFQALIGNGRRWFYLELWPEPESGKGISLVNVDTESRCEPPGFFRRLLGWWRRWRTPS